MRDWIIVTMIVGFFLLAFVEPVVKAFWPVPATDAYSLEE